ncbi:MAG: methyl-accepting chemotaxis protein [Gammaproteobacteria bacterium]
MRFSDLKIGTKLTVGFALSGLLLVGVTILGVLNMAAINDRLEGFNSVNIAELDMSTTLQFTVADRMIALRNLVLLSEATDMQPEAERIRRDAARYATAFGQLTRLVNAEDVAVPGLAEQLRTIAQSADAAQAIIDKAVQLGLTNQDEEARLVLMKELRPVQFKWQRAIDALIELQKRRNDDQINQSHQQFVSARSMMLVLAGIALMAAVIVGRLIKQSITVPLGRAVEVARTVAGGDLTSVIEVESRNETGQLLHALQTMNANLRGLVGRIRTGTDLIATASGEIASGNLDLSSRTEQQAGALEETASSMEQMTATVKQNAESARQANALAIAASDVAVKGGGVVADVVATMSDIHDSARRIADIIGVIDGIAFQTNILALNAAVEAARAGEQGRGFAVVATEVRNLAQRSAGAAKEIKELINDSVNKVAQGAQLVATAGQTMDEVVDGVRRVTDIMGEISAASQEQEAGISNINRAISDMDSATQQNAALVEQAAAAAQAMQEQSGELATMVSSFRLDAEGPGMQAPPHPAPQRGAPDRDRLRLAA